MSDNFRFETLEIWKEAIALSRDLLHVADLVEMKKRFRFAEQLRSATLSISNNIAEGSGSYSDKDFAYFLNVSRRSLFECVNMLHILEIDSIITSNEREAFYPPMLRLSKRISAFRARLR